jgi:hypothetical protein
VHAVIEVLVFFADLFSIQRVQQVSAHPLLEHLQSGRKIKTSALVKAN